MHFTKQLSIHLLPEHNSNPFKIDPTASCKLTVINSNVNYLNFANSNSFKAIALKMMTILRSVITMPEMEKGKEILCEKLKES